MSAAAGPFDFCELARADHTGLPAPAFVTARDGARLAVRRYPAASDTVVVALHGSSGDGIYFHTLARILSKSNVAAVYVPDLRGHGASAGSRGDLDYIGQLEDDLDDVIAYVRGQRPCARIVLLGHSSGGGLAVRFAGGRRETLIAGYVLLAPFLGAGAAPTRPASGGWAQVDLAKLGELSARAADGDAAGQHQIVLRFNKPPAQRTGREVLAYSFRMTLAYQPRPDLASDLAAIRRPLLVLAGSRDLAFVPELYEPTIAPHAGGTFRVLPGLSHFGVVVERRAIEEVAAWLSTEIVTRS